MSVYFWRFGGWIWLGRYWFYASYDPGYQPLFSERYGYTKMWRLGSFVFKHKTKTDT